MIPSVASDTPPRPGPDDELRIVFAGGGSGGHIYPALAVAREALARPGKPCHVLFLVTPEGLEKGVVESHGLPCATIPAVRLVARNALSILPGMWAGIRAARQAMRVFRPHVLYGTGGFVSFPAVVAAWLEGVPALLHEPNTVPGRANRLLARISRGVVTHFEQSACHFPRGLSVHDLGTPLRYEYDPGRRQTGSTRTLLILGGSQGARRLNMVVRSLYHRLAAKVDLRVIHLTGTRDHAEVVAGLGQGHPNVEIVAYTEEMDKILYRTDFAVCRAGALTVSELVEFSVPAIYVPFPGAVGNHQFENARSLKERGASEILEETELTEERLMAEIDRMSQAQNLQKYRAALVPFRRPGATRRVLEALDSLVHAASRADGD